MTKKTEPVASQHKTLVNGVDTTGGVHCETTALGVLLNHAGLTLSEPMIFGLGSGLSFIYWDSARQELPFLGGRVKPFGITENVCQQLGLNLRVHETSSASKAWVHVTSAIHSGTPVGLQLDSFDLEYFGSRVHFAGHVVALYGYDTQRAYLVDTAQQGGDVSTSLESLARARAARGPMSARHRSFTVEGSPTQAFEHDELVQIAIRATVACAGAFLAPPISNLGGRGIRTTALRIRSWFDRIENPGRDFAVIAMLMERAGTGGALFRNMYRDFLAECEGLLGGDHRAQTVGQGKELFTESAALWTRVATLIEHAGATGAPEHLRDASQLLEEIAELETTAMTLLSSLGSGNPRNS